MDPRRSPSPWLRWPLVATLAATAGIHISLVSEHLREAPYAAALFMALSAAAIWTACLLTRSYRPLVWDAAGVLSLMALVGYATSRSVGLPSMTDDVGDWLNPLGIAALGCETAAVIMSVGAARRRVARAFPRAFFRSDSSRRLSP